jgi:broad specificity phosphatase PhoE
MPRRLYFISHPNVVVSSAVPVPRWPLSATGRARMVEGLKQPWVRSVTSIYASTEQKAVDTAAILAGHLSIGFQQVEDLGENDRSSTGFLEPPDFEAMANAFFANPQTSVRGWERAADAQQRIVRAVSAIAQQDTSVGSIAIVSHGAVGTLLYCHLTGKPISRAWDQPPNGGGNFYAFTLTPPRADAGWAAIDVLPALP